VENDKFIRIPEMAAELKISRGRAYALVADGTIPAVKIGRSLRVSRRELRSWLATCRYVPGEQR
jgi:excisionase family DNA binding protein